MTKSSPGLKTRAGDEPGLARDGASPAAEVATIVSVTASGFAVSVLTDVTRQHGEADGSHVGEGPTGGSGVYVVERESAAGGSRGKGNKGKKMNPILEQVTLVVYGWKSVEPGTLSWVFPSVGAAVAAARAMKNAVRWAILAGRRSTSDDEDEGLEQARAHGAVLIEQAG